jgi:hypothetical protein
VLEPTRLVRPRDDRLLAHALGADDDVVEVEVDIGEGGQELRVEARGALMTLPARTGAHDLVHAVLGQRRDEPRKVAVVLGDRVGLPELPDLRVLVDVDGATEKLEDAVAGHAAPFGESVRRIRTTRPARTARSSRARSSTASRAAARERWSPPPGR